MKVLNKVDYLVLFILISFHILTIIVQVNFLWWILYLTISLVFIFMPKIYGFECISFMIPFYGILYIPGYQRIILAYLVAFFIFVRYIKNAKDFLKPLGEINILFILLMMSIILSLLNFRVFSFKDVDYLLIVVLLIFLRQIVPTSAILIRKILLFYIFGLILSGCLGFYLHRGRDIYGQYFRIVGCVGDPNYFSRALLFGISYIILFLKDSFNLNKKWIIFLIIMELAIFIEIIFTYSKMGVMILLLLLIIQVFTIFKDRKFYILFIVLLCGIALYSGVFSDTSIIEIYQTRFKVEDINIFTTRRYNIQIASLQGWLEANIGEQILGSGLLSQKIIVEKKIGIKAVAHSIYVQTLVEQGLLGLSIFFLLFYIFFRKGLKRGILVIFIVYALSGLALSGLFYWDQFLFYLIYDKYNIDIRN